jgi:branched-chain amino acid transport system ATP-binding protein
MANILIIEGLKKCFDGILALDDISLDIRPGRITGIIGPNGSGKTTLLDILSGLESPDDGTITIGDSAGIGRIRACQNPSFGLTRTFQEARLFEQMTVLDNVLVALYPKNVFKSLFDGNRDSHLEMAISILRSVGLSGKQDELAVNLSYGQRKLLEIGRALSVEAVIFLLDEPFAGLSPRMIRTVADFFRGLKAEDGTVILVEHNMALIRELCDDLIVMDGGRILSKGRPSVVLGQKKVVNAYLGT